MPDLPAIPEAPVSRLAGAETLDEGVAMKNIDRKSVPKAREAARKFAGSIAVYVASAVNRRAGPYGLREQSQVIVDYLAHAYMKGYQ